MQQQNRTEIVQDITSAVKLEQELRRVHEKHGVAVLDVYSAEWGLSKALSETFRRLHMDASDQTCLCFFSVECNSILDSIDQTEEQHAHMKASDKVKFRESLSTFWKDILESRRGKSKSYFVFFKEGRKRTSIEGINTPKIISCVNELCRQQKPAKECTESKSLLDFWGRYFSEGESEVFWESFVRALLEHVGSTRSLSTKEESALADAIGVKGNKVGIDELDKWACGQPMEKAFADIFPSLSLAEGGDAAGGKRKTSGDRLTDDGTLNESFVNVLTSHCDARTEWKPDVWHRILALEPQFPVGKRLALRSCEEAEKDVAEALALAADLPTVEAYLKGYNVAVETVHVMCHAAAEKYKSETAAYARLAQLLLTCNGDRCEELIGVRQELVDELSEGTLLKNHPTLAYTVMCYCTLGIPDGKQLYFHCDDVSRVDQVEDTKEGDLIVLPPLTPLSSDAGAVGGFKVEICGVSKAIQLGIAEQGEPTTVLTPWFTKCNVKESSDDHLVLEFVEYVAEEQLQQVLESYIAQICNDEDKLSAAADIIALYERSLGLGHEISVPSFPTQNNFAGSGIPASGSSVGSGPNASGVGKPQGDDAVKANAGDVTRTTPPEVGGAAVEDATTEGDHEEDRGAAPEVGGAAVEDATTEGDHEEDRGAVPEVGGAAVEDATTEGDHEEDRGAAPEVGGAAVEDATTEGDHEEDRGAAPEVGGAVVEDATTEGDHEEDRGAVPEVGGAAVEDATTEGDHEEDRGAAPEVGGAAVEDATTEGDHEEDRGAAPEVGGAVVEDATTEGDHEEDRGAAPEVGGAAVEDATTEGDHEEDRGAAPEVGGAAVEDATTEGDHEEDRGAAPEVGGAAVEDATTEGDHEEDRGAAPEVGGAAVEDATTEGDHEEDRGAAPEVGGAAVEDATTEGDHEEDRGAAPEVGGAAVDGDTQSSKEGAMLEATSDSTFERPEGDRMSAGDGETASGQPSEVAMLAGAGEASEENGGTQ